ncbi:fumarylacetoacetate FAA hydrolase family protein [Variibacter gotjawalensis]|uniref:fumarylacetoacetase n=1 Tax=Variibacter gotjawalensis TaxID=1333996 RepID=A0A0S3PZT5_9BRAD|nr:fumarylacetoacetase [Variibacter gotjawalensis]NIK47259.1 fumarylacetoacetase [Variibacter gotjawalensis]RZS49159.1 fumarylacetoacetate hydrolase [Variibacter gotjawalensis]BAT61421.1 fumarylacetoacetate FAA hydrolase family protein [Variibacter gotjawalensis]
MKSWIESANAPECHFPIQNLPYGAFRRADEAVRCGVAIGDQVLDLSVLEATGLIDAGSAPVFAQPTINAFMALGPTAWDSVREQLQSLLSHGGDDRLRGNDALRKRALVPMAEAELMLPIRIGGYTDFYAGKQHAFNVGTMFRGPENALPPNWLHIPIGYNGRASTVVVSGTDIRRPLGQMKAPDAAVPSFGPCKRLDIELEMGAIVGTPNRMGEPVTVAQADDMIFGYVLLNDWSARDIQAWEYVPLGPFQGKVFATSISPWVVTKAALAPFRVATPAREKELLPYLNEGGKPLLYDINLEVLMRPSGAKAATTLARTNYRNMYYSAAQQLAHHAVGGCKMETGDLLGSGTISGADKTGYGSLLEMSWGGKEPITLDSGEKRSFIEDGDTMTLTGWAAGDGYRIGFGECSGTILPSPKEPKW